MASEHVMRAVSGSTDFERVELPEYLCHKVVRAGAIVAVTFLRQDTYRMVLEGGCHVDVSKNWIHRHNPLPGGVYVQYEDGYSSFSPRQSFEDGYTRFDPVADATKAQGSTAANVEQLAIESKPLTDAEVFAKMRAGAVAREEFEIPVGATVKQAIDTVNRLVFGVKLRVRPTIDELEKILIEDSDVRVIVLPDGSVRAIDAPAQVTQAEQAAKLHAASASADPSMDGTAMNAVQQGPSEIGPAGTAYVGDAGNIVGISDGEKIVPVDPTDAASVDGSRDAAKACFESAVQGTADPAGADLGTGTGPAVSAEDLDAIAQEQAAADATSADPSPASMASEAAEKPTTDAPDTSSSTAGAMSMAGTGDAQP